MYLMRKNVEKKSGLLLVSAAVSKIATDREVRLKLVAYAARYG